MSSWQKFEELAEKIYKELAPSANVVRDDRIMGKESNIERQIDVSIRHKIANHNILVIVQARDHKQKADVNDVGEFATVIKDVRANKGILICKGGFTNGAKSLAQNLGIDLCNLHDAQSRDWVLDLEIPVLWIDLAPILQLGVKIFFEGGEQVQKEMKNWQFSLDNGKTLFDPIKVFESAWNEGRIPREVGEEYTFDLLNKNAKTLIMNKEGSLAWREVELGMKYQVKRRTWLGSFTPEECRGILNYQDGTFRPSYLPIGQIPMKRDESWQEIEDPDKLAIEVPGLLVTTEGWQIIEDSAKFSDLSIQKISD